MAELNLTNSSIEGHRVGDPAAAQSKDVLTIFAWTWIVIAVVLGTMLYLGTRPPSVEWAATGDRVTISSGLYSQTVYRAGVSGVSLLDTLPPVHKRSGFNAGRYLRGLFEVDGLGRASVFLTTGVSPYLLITTRTEPLIVNFRNPDDTRRVHDEFRQRWQVPERAPEFSR